jgi:DNA-binding helix-hairpin-helix protein with protein kinase domain
MDLLQASDRSLVRLVTRPVLGSGGEANVFAVKDRPALAAKIYHRPARHRVAKLNAMLRNPPEKPDMEPEQIPIAWPLDLLIQPNRSGQVVGFLMPRVHGASAIIDVYHPKTRRKKRPLFNYRYLLRAGRNLAACVGALHARGYVIGDLNESNIFVTDTALVSLVDTDSFQVPDTTTGSCFRCAVGKVEFTPPELQGVSFAWVERKQEHDCFGLAVLVFQLLMEGIHPFAGTHFGTGEPPALGERIAAGWFPYKPGHILKALPMPTSPRFDTLNNRVQELFLRCFVAAHNEPAKRPSPNDWQVALLEAENSLITCQVNEQHQYTNTIRGCPWCERAELFGIDAFPSRLAVGARTNAASKRRQVAVHPPGMVSYEDAIAIASAAAGRKRIMLWVTISAALIIGSGLIAYWGYAIQHWVLQR